MKYVVSANISGLTPEDMWEVQKGIGSLIRLDKVTNTSDNRGLEFYAQMLGFAGASEPTERRIFIEGYGLLENLTYHVKESAYSPTAERLITLGSRELKHSEAISLVSL